MRKIILAAVSASSLVLAPLATAHADPTLQPDPGYPCSQYLTNSGGNNNTGLYHACCVDRVAAGMSPCPADWVTDIPPRRPVRSA
jgi:hypothetical protein